MKKKLLFVIPLSLFVLDYLLIYFQIIQPLDWMIYHLVQNLRCDFMTSFFKLCSTLGSTWFYVLLINFFLIFKVKTDWYGAKDKKFDYIGSIIYLVMIVILASIAFIVSGKVL